MSRQRLTREQRITAYHRFSGRCWYCGTTLDPFNFEIDHITPVKDGGGEEPGNLAATCPPCNLSKGTRSLQLFREYGAARSIGMPRFTQEQIDWLFHREGLDLIGRLPVHRFYFEKVAA